MNLIKKRRTVWESRKCLKHLGWKIHRIHHKDWYDNREEAEKELLEAVKNAIGEKSGVSMHGGILTEEEWEHFYSTYSDSDLNPEFVWCITEVTGKGLLKVDQNPFLMTSIKIIKMFFPRMGYSQEAEWMRFRDVLPDLNPEPIWCITEGV